MRPRMTPAVAGALMIACVAVYGPPAWTSGITNWDDRAYLDHPGARAISTATFTHVVMGHYHPLTMFSFAVQEQLFGAGARLTHLINVALHALSSALVVWLLALLTGSDVAAAIGGFFFAIHPLRVESVLWIAERKDVLFVLFYVAALVTYVISQRRRSSGLQFATAIFFLLSLLAKSAAVTFPLALLMVDYVEGRLNWRMAVRKTPYFIVSSIFGAIALTAGLAEKVSSLPGHHFSLVERIALSCTALLSYLGKIFLPLGLSAFYPYPADVGREDLVAVACTALIGAIAVLSARWNRTIPFSSGFFAATISVTLPLISVGPVVAADRYTYVPSIGIAYGVGFASMILIRKSRWFVIPLLAAAGMLVVATISRAHVWRNSVTLWSSVIDYDATLAKAWNGRGAALAESGADAEAWRDFSTALAIDPCYSTALGNRILLALKHGDYASAGRDRSRAVRCGFANGGQR